MLDLWQRFTTAHTTRRLGLAAHDVVVYKFDVLLIIFIGVEVILC